MKYTPLQPRPRKRGITAVLLISLCAFLVMSLFATLLSIGTCIFSRGGKCYRGYESPYSFNLQEAYNPDWMASIPDEVNITSLSIPGTHDTMTYDMVRNIRLQCQNYNLSTQLHAGMRYFDIRGRLVNHTIGIYHSYSYTGYTFTDVLLEMFAFLDDHPSEVIVMRLKEEGRPIGDTARQQNKTFEEVFNNFRHQDPETAPGFEKYLYEVPAEAPNQPTFQPWEMHAARSSSLRTFRQDLWIIPTVEHLEDKWAAIKTNLHLARDTPDDNSVLFLSHLSASFGVLPIEAAAGPLSDKDILGMNDRTGEWLDQAGSSGRTGIVIVDFPGKAIVDSVIERNAGLAKKTVDGR
ncbi:unnamed protein product [Parascedosporium putredinis]|uniref:Phosphatidylinositol-specific phospholipase C X domain-containing protein n=1 Tax=Parascedosporium putredinis TaxID=1442378 RepID=A0A9P1H6Q2_9PEZI|nr:unnamed protein product [Parascedosporium putredinis]CAI7998896.1 unnamed protein product [Parascedosporium putredinis]